MERGGLDRKFKCDGRNFDVNGKKIRGRELLSTLAGIV
jgi:hypothetical protein